MSRGVWAGALGLVLSGASACSCRWGELLGAGMVAAAVSDTIAVPHPPEAAGAVRVWLAVRAGEGAGWSIDGPWEIPPGTYLCYSREAMVAGLHAGRGGGMDPCEPWPAFVMTDFGDGAACAWTYLPPHEEAERVRMGRGATSAPAAPPLALDELPRRPKTPATVVSTDDLWPACLYGPVIVPWESEQR